jgi:hypothetical protein
LPELQKLADDYAEKGVALVTVVTGRNTDRARATAARLGIHAPVVLVDAPLQIAYHVDAVPWTVVIGRDGKAAFAFRGGQTRKTFQAEVDKLL